MQPGVAWQRLSCIKGAGGQADGNMQSDTNSGHVILWDQRANKSQTVMNGTASYEEDLSETLTE